jgi:hypothetical protein
MATVSDPKRAHYVRASRKASKTRHLKIVAALTEAAEKIEALNAQLEALVHRGAR